MSVLDTISKMTPPEARDYLKVNGYAPGDVEDLMAQWKAAPVAKVMPEARPSQTPRPAPASVVEDDEDDDE